MGKALRIDAGLRDRGGGQCGEAGVGLMGGASDAKLRDYSGEPVMQTA